MLENVQRQDLSPIEEAEGYRRLIDEFGHTQAELAETIGKSRSHIANLLRLLALPDAGAGDARRRHPVGRPRARPADGQRPRRLARTVVSQGLNVRQTEKLVQADKKTPGLPRRPVAKDADTRDLEHDLSRRIGLKVTLKPARNGGTLTIAYRTLDQLDAVVARLREDGAARRQARQERLPKIPRARPDAAL